MRRRRGGRRRRKGSEHADEGPPPSFPPPPFLSSRSIVEFSTVDEANYAIANLNDTELKGRKMQVREVSPRPL